MTTSQVDRPDRRRRAARLLRRGDGPAGALLMRHRHPARRPRRRPARGAPALLAAACSASTRAGPGARSRGSARSSASSTALLRIDPERDMRWARVRARPSSLFSLVSALASSTRCSALQGVAAAEPGGPEGRPPGPRVQHRRLVRDQHELAVLLARARPCRYLTQMVGLAVQNFVSAAVGMAVAVALVRGFVRSGAATSATSGPTSCAARSTCCSRSRSCSASCCSRAASCRRSTGPATSRRWPAATQTIARGPFAEPGCDQAARHERRRLLQRQLGAPVREPTPFTNLLEIWACC